MPHLKILSCLAFCLSKSNVATEPFLGDPSMKPGATFVWTKILFAVEIQGRGGDSVQDKYFVTAEEAIFASALDGRNLEPQEVEVMEFSDGNLMLDPNFVSLSKGPTEEERRKLLDNLTPAQRLILRGGK